MSSINLAQHRQNLKSLQQALIKTSHECQQAQSSFTELQTQARRAWCQVNHTWSQLIDLFVLIDEMIDEVEPRFPDSDTKTQKTLF